MPKLPPDPLNRKTLRQAFRCWDNSQKLGAHPLARLKTVEARRRSAGYGDTPAGYGVALRDVLHDALARLKPADAPDPGDKRWRSYLILHSQYLEGRSPDYLISQFSIARSTYDHEQANAFESLADVLREWEQAPPSGAAASEPSERPPFLAPLRPPQPLVGRQALLRELKAELFTRRLIAINGLPGVGKTALALELAHDPEVLARFVDGVLWVGLGRKPDPLATLGAWAVALGLPLDEIAKLARVEDRARLIHAAIGLRQLLLVIDDAWGIDEALAFKIGGPNCAYLLTTRLPKVALDFAGEAALPVHELAEADGLALLAQYGAAVAEGEARSLVSAAGGLPLALTLMGRYLQKEAHPGQPRRVRAAIDRLQQIGERLSLAQTRSPLDPQPDTPLSLLTVIAGTDEALDAGARLALRALSVFPPKPNTFSEEAALAVCGAAVGMLDTLVDYGLLECVPAGRYTLHQTIAEYAAQTRSPKSLDLGQNQEILDSFSARLVAYFVRFIEDHAADDLALEPEIANSLAALNAAHEQGMRSELLRGANAFYPFLETRGLYTLAEIHLQRAAAAARFLNDRARLCAALGNHARVLQRRGDYAAAETAYREAQALARELNDPDSLSALLSGLGVLAFSRGDYPQAEAYYHEGLALAREHQLRDRLSALLTNAGTLALTRGDAARAEAYFHEGLTLARALAHRSRVSALLINLGVMAARRGDYARADACFQESLELARAAKHREALMFLLTNLGTLANDQKDTARADAYFHEALALAREMDDRARISHLLANLGALAAGQKDYARAGSCYQEGLALARAIGHRENITLLLMNWGEMEGEQGNVSLAQECYAEALALAKEMGHQRYVGMIEAGLGKLKNDKR